MKYYSNEEDPTPAGIALMLLIGLGIVCGFIWFKSSMESKTYNKLTGAHTTTWDAIWVELRVQDAPNH